MAKVYIVIKNGCINVDTGKPCDYWQWQGSLDKDGYGKCNPCNHLGEQFASRYMYKKHRGPIPKGKEIDHLCNHRDCVNPFTVELVTHKVNCQRRNRRKPHLNQQNRKFTDKQVTKIRHLHKLGKYSISALGRLYNVSFPTIKRICNGKTYKHTKLGVLC